MTAHDKTLRHLKWLIWTYFWLLILEGALRKWIVPQLSNPLLIVRDPVVVAIYILAIRARVFPGGAWMWSLGIIGALCFGITILQLFPYISPQQIALVDLFGFRSNFLHLPLIFVMGRVLSLADVRKFGWWTLVILIPMTLLLLGQFRAAPDAFLNRTAGGEGEMMTAALGKVRTAGTFSFVLGVVAFYSLATGYIVWAFLKRGVYNGWLINVAAGALVVGAAVSGSRSVIGACAAVIASLLLVLFIRPDALNRFGAAILLLVVMAAVLSRLPVFKEGIDVLSARFNDVAEASQTTVAGDIWGRFTSSFSDGLFVIGKAPIFGYGLGIGTNAGARFLTGHATFLLSEGEWSRVFLESGPILGLAFIVWRCAIAIHLGWLSVRSLKAGNLLPLLLITSAIMPLISGQFGQPTVLGFCVFVAGLALAARNPEEISGGQTTPLPRAGRIPPPLRARSKFAVGAHNNTSDFPLNNGAADR